MTQIEKLKIKLFLLPKDFSWSELIKILIALEYKETQAGRTSGSRVRFVHDDFEPISLHKPHPKATLKRYQIKQVLETLKNRGQL